jgi:hypothetical protein
MCQNQEGIGTKRKRGHAWGSGVLVGVNEERPSDFDKVVYYNPYKTSHFIHGEHIITKAEEVFSRGNSVLFASVNSRTH